MEQFAKIINSLIKIIILTLIYIVGYIIATPVAFIAWNIFYIKSAYESYEEAYHD